MHTQLSRQYRPTRGRVNSLLLAEPDETDEPAPRNTRKRK